MADQADSDLATTDTRGKVKRRMLLQAAAATPIAAQAASAKTRAPGGKDGRIDVQFHFSPPYYTELVKQTKHLATDRWGVDKALAYMDENHVAAGVMSVSTPSVNFLPAADGVALARRLNTDMAAVIRDNPTRFGSFATLPMLDVPATLSEIAYSLDTLHLDGVAMMSNVGGLYLGHPSFAPIFDELNRRKAVIFVHPTDPVDYGQLKMAPVVEWPFDTCRAAIDLVYSGTMRRCPDISVILAHAGGALPAVAERVEEMSFIFSAAHPPVFPPEAKAQIGKFYYDLAIAAHENAIGALRAVSGLGQVLFACDWPFAPPPAIAINVKGFEGLKLTPTERHNIERGNASRLFPRLVPV